MQPVITTVITVVYSHTNTFFLCGIGLCNTSHHKTQTPVPQKAALQGSITMCKRMHTPTSPNPHKKLKYYKQ